MWAQISLKRSLENELRASLITSKNISKYIPETSLKYDVFDGTIEELKIAAETDERWKQPGVIYFVDPSNTSEESSDTNSKDEYLYIKNGETGNYEKIGSTRSDINILFSPNDIYNVTAEDSNISFNNISDGTTKTLTFTANTNGYTINTNNGNITLTSSTNLAYDKDNNIDTYYNGISLGTYLSFYNDEAYVFDKISLFNNNLLITENKSIHWFTDKDDKNAFFDVQAIKADDNASSYQLVWSSNHNLSYINFAAPVKFSGSVSFEGKMLSDTLSSLATNDETLFENTAKLDTDIKTLSNSCVKTDDALYQKLVQLDESGKLDKLIELVEYLTIQ